MSTDLVAYTFVDADGNALARVETDAREAKRLGKRLGLLVTEHQYRELRSDLAWDFRDLDEQESAA